MMRFLLLNNSTKMYAPAVPVLLCLQLATATAGVDVVKVVERQPSLLLLDDSSPLADWSKLDQEELRELIQVEYVTSPLLCSSTLHWSLCNASRPGLVLN